jgi:ATP-dependent DNA helicase RecG
MTKDELIAKLSDLEWEDFEVKEAKGEVPKSAWETVSAFSNTAGGWLVFGVKQTGPTFEVVKMTNPEKIEQDFLGVLRGAQKFNTLINPTCARYELEGEVVLAFYIPVSPNKPVYFNTQSNTYIRRGSADQKATQAEIDAMYRDQTFGTKSSELAVGTGLADLKEKSIREYRDYMSRFNPGVSYNRMELDEFLVKMRIIDRESRQCTFAGLLFFGNRESVEKFFADFRIDLIEVPGTSYEDASSRYTFRLTEDDYENLWEAYFECFKRLRKEVDVEFKISSEGFGEELSPGLLALREALVNMLMHADYFAPACPRVRIFTNHIEYYNPGGLPKPLEDLKGKDLSMPRNPILAKLFRMVKLAENAGYGFDKIDDNWKTYNNSTPKYLIDFDSVIVKLTTKQKTILAPTDLPVVSQEKTQLEELRKTFKMHFSDVSSVEIITFLRGNYGVFMPYLRSIWGESSVENLKKFGLNQSGVRSIYNFSSEQNNFNLNDNALAIVLLMLLNENITAKELATILAISQRAVEKQLAKLVNEQLIRREGSDKTGVWLIQKQGVKR